MDIITNWIKSAYKELSKYQKIAFITAIICGVFSHGYALGNNYIYHDATILNGLGTTFGLGRWALGYCGEINNLMFGNLHLPFFNIAASLVLLALSAMVVVKTLCIESDFLAGFIGGIFSVYPVVTSTFAYNFSATYYFLALLLAVMAVAVCDSYIDIKAIILLTLSAGFYQAYLSVAVTLALSIILIDLLTSDKELIDIVRKGVKYIITFVLSLILYLVINKISLIIMKPPATGYQGAENMGALNLSKIPGRLVQTYLHFFYIKWNGINAASCMWVFTILFLVVAATVAILCVIKEKLPAAKIGLFLLGVIVMPIAVNLVYLMSTDENYSIHTLMRFATVFVLILPAVLMEKLSKNRFQIPSAVCAIFLTVITVSYIYSNNAAYIKMNLVQEEMKSFFTVLETRICQTEGFDDNMPVVFSGEFKIVDENMTDINEVYPDIVILGYEYNARDLINRESWKNYMKYRTGFAPQIIDMPADIASSEEFASLKVYPDDDSIAIINGIVVVKLSE
ncbi:MAG: glucosyltransferase domain-containing protein [Lachnospiraceae bacterium]|nr:glucosyltransferase domain-containing protein [Lachnospiraceae bacterium]